MTPLVRQAAAARAWVVAAHTGVPLRLAGSEHAGWLDGSPTLTQQVARGLHRFVAVVVEVFVPGAQVVQPRLAVGAGGEPVLGAAGGDSVL